MKLSFYQLAYSGFFACSNCERPSEPVDPDAIWLRCKYCHETTLKWIPPVPKPESVLAQLN